MTIRRVSVFLPRVSEFYAGLLGQMLRGFRAAGVEAEGAMGHLGADALRQWCDAHRPDLVLEMNRPRCDADGLPRDVQHACWVVDFNGRPLSHFVGSDATYLFAESWVPHYPGAGFFRWMGPGACDHDYPEVPHVHRHDVGFVGHIPKPWTDAELARDVSGHGVLCFGDLLPDIERLLRLRSTEPDAPAVFLGKVDDACRERCGHGLHMDDALRYDVTCRVVRHVNRIDLVDAAIDRGRSVAIHGPENWSQWPKYAPHYRGWLSSPAAMHRAYAETAVHLHEGTGVHFRSMDAMSSGALLLWRRTAYDHLVGGIAEQFEPGVHYVPFDLDSLGDTIDDVLGDPVRAAKMRRDAAAAIRAGHTWRHRAAAVLRDFAGM